MRKVLFCFLLASIALESVNAKPVANTPLGDAIAKAPVILLAETGPKEFDNLKPGEIRKSNEISFECRKQSFRVLKIYRNNTGKVLQVGNSILINDKSNGCIDFEITIQRKGNKLEINRLDEKNSPYTIEIINHRDKVVLFLEPDQPNAKSLEHYGWFVSPHEYNNNLESQIMHAINQSVRRGVHLTSGCDE